MNGAESLVRTLKLGGIEVCFTNPGTSEMHFVAALDRTNALKCVLGLQENIVTGAADGYARMAGKPAATLLHTGPGLGNGLGNLHNANKAQSPMVNIVGDHATYHIEYNAPLTADVEGIARPVSQWVKTSPTAEGVAADGAEAVRQARVHPGRIATLILPANTAWGNGSEPVGALIPNAPVPPAADTVERIAKLLTEAGETGGLYLKGQVLREPGITLAGKVAKKTGCRLFAPTSNARIDRGAGRVAVDRVPYVVDQALAKLADVKLMVGVGDVEPVAFFAYPDKPSRVLPDGCQVQQLATEAEDGVRALEMLVEALDAVNAVPVLAERGAPELPTGPLDADGIAAVAAAMMPENAIVIDESITSGRHLNWQTAGAEPHSWLSVCGGAIGIGPPLAAGAAVACPDRKVVALQADGSAMYTLQALWTQAREGLDVTTVIYSNRAYKILQGEMTAVGVDKPGKVAEDMFGLDRPDLDWVSLARGMGVEGERVDQSDAFIKAFERGLATSGPFLIEAVI